MLRPDDSLAINFQLTGATGVSPVHRGGHWRHASGTQSAHRDL